MKQLVIFDYHTESIHIYNIKEFNIVNDDYITFLGFDPDSVTIMMGIEIPIIKHKEKL